MKSAFSVYDPMVQQALRAQGSQYVLPPQSMSAPIDTSAQLTPDDQALAQALQAQRVQEDANAAQAAYMHLPAQGAPQSAPQPLGGVSLDWNPPQSSPPMAMMQQEQPPELEQMPRRAAAAPMRSKERLDESVRDLAGTYDTRQEAAQEIGASRAQTVAEQGRIRERSSVDDMMAQQELSDATADHEAAVGRVRAQQAEDTEFVRNYQPSDRRSIGQKAIGAIAVALSGIGDAYTAMGGGQPQAVSRTVGIINQAIDRDIELQGKMLDNKRTAITARNTELGQMRERYGDKQSAIKMSYAMRIEQYQRELETAAAAGQSAEQAAITKDTNAQLEAQKQQLYMGVANAEYQRELKARQGMSLEKRLGLQGKLLDNEGKMLDNEKKRSGEADQTADERKVNRQLGAVRPATQRLEKAMGAGDSPYWGVREGMQGLPDALVSNKNIQYRNDVMAVAGQALRDDSGAVLGPKELSDKLDRMGVFNGSPDLRNQGLRDLMYEYNSRLNRGQPGKQSAGQAARARLRPGAAR